MRTQGAEAIWSLTFNLILEGIVSQTPPSRIGEAAICKVAKVADRAREAYSARFGAGPNAKEEGNQPRTTVADNVDGFDEFDEESVLLNRAVRSSLMDKADGKKRVNFNCGGLVKYNGASSIFLPRGDSRVTLERVRPTPALKDIVPLSQIPTYEDMFSMVKDRFWGGEASTFKWSIYTHGHRQMATDTFTLDADPAKQEQTRKAAETSRVQQNETPLPPPAESVAPQYPHPCHPPFPFPFSPPAGAPMPPSYQRPFPQPGTLAGVPQQVQTRPPSSRKRATGNGWIRTGLAAKAMGLSMDQLRKVLRVKATEQKTKDGCNVMMGNGIVAKKFGSIWMLNLPKG